MENNAIKPILSIKACLSFSSNLKRCQPLARIEDARLESRNEDLLQSVQNQILRFKWNYLSTALRFI